MNDINAKIYGMIKVCFIMNFVFLIVGLLGIITKTSFLVVVSSNIVFLGSMFILKKNEHLLNGVMATNKLAKDIGELIN